MRIAIVGGLFRKGSWQASGVRTPETILRTGLLESGHDIEVFSHQAPELSTLGSFDVIHVHHLSWEQSLPPNFAVGAESALLF